MFDVKALAAEAEKEYREERLKEDKEKIKILIDKIEKAKLIVRNLEREKEDLLIKISE